MLSRCWIDFGSILDRFSIDFRGLEEDRRRLGGGMGRIGGLEEDCRSLGGAVEEDGPPKYGLGTPQCGLCTPQYGLGTPQYGDYVATSWKNDICFPK